LDRAIADGFGFQQGIALALDLAKAADKVAEQPSALFFAAISDYEVLNGTQKAAIRDDLASSGILAKVQRALFPLTHFHPSCPINFLSSGGQPCEPSEALASLKELLDGLFNNELRSTVLVQATVVYIAFVSGRFKVREGLTLAKFPEIEEYPKTELSKRLASAIRATVIGFFGRAERDTHSRWPATFWNRGLGIEKCEF
jgi:hypothetical protein